MASRKTRSNLPEVCLCVYICTLQSLQFPTSEKSAICHPWWISAYAVTCSAKLQSCTSKMSELPRSCKVAKLQSWSAMSELPRSQQSATLSGHRQSCKVAHQHEDPDPASVSFSLEADLHVASLFHDGLKLWHNHVQLLHEFFGRWAFLHFHRLDDTLRELFA